MTLDKTWQNTMSKKLLVVSSLLVVLAGCSSKPDNANQMTMREVHEQHKQHLYGGNIDEVRQSWSVIDRVADTRLQYADDLRLPNPELEMYFFPKRDHDGAVSAGFKKKFSMYEKVHYQLGY